jgi:hypothetical protein
MPKRHAHAQSAAEIARDEFASGLSCGRGRICHVVASTTVGSVLKIRLALRQRTMLVILVAQGPESNQRCKDANIREYKNPQRHASAVQWSEIHSKDRGAQAYREEEKGDRRDCDRQSEPACHQDINLAF